MKAHISRGPNTGILLTPHQHDDGTYVASHTRFERDYLRVDSVAALVPLVRAGYGVRMSSPIIKVAPSLIAPASIKLEDLRDNSESLVDVLKQAESELDLDPRSWVKRRKEQSLLRALLLDGRAEAACAICGATLPESLLVAAHIKRRADCTATEKLDFRAVAALMCRLGCDALFEYGFLVVRNGVTTSGNVLKASEALEGDLRRRTGKRVANWNVSQSYYEWHAKKHLGSSATRRF